MTPENSDRIKRAIAFYFSVALFLALLPIVLSYALGYQIDYHALKVYKTGIIYLNSNPAGASIYINGKESRDLTPAQIEELKPGSYKVEVRRDGFYPWEKEIEVRPNMVTKADRIKLFPLIQDIKKVYSKDIADFAISDRNFIYYMTGSGLYRSDPDGAGVKMLSRFSGWPEKIIGKRFSADRSKFLYFDEKKVTVVYLDADKNQPQGSDCAKAEDALVCDDRIADAFWYSGSAYLIVVTSKEIKAVELRGEPGKNVFSLYRFNSPPKSVYYDDYNDSIYFTDVLKTSDGKESRCLYRMDLREKLFDQLIKLLTVKKDQEAGYEKR